MNLKQQCSCHSAEPCPRMRDAMNSCLRRNDNARRPDGGIRVSYQHPKPIPPLSFRHEVKPESIVCLVNAIPPDTGLGCPTR
jgi:hypothetical protein